MTSSGTDENEQPPPSAETSTRVEQSASAAQSEAAKQRPFWRIPLVREGLLYVGVFLVSAILLLIRGDDLARLGTTAYLLAVIWITAALPQGVEWVTARSERIDDEAAHTYATGIVPPAPTADAAALEESIELMKGVTERLETTIERTERTAALIPGFLAVTAGFAVTNLPTPETVPGRMLGIIAFVLFLRGALAAVMCITRDRPLRTVSVRALYAVGQSVHQYRAGVAYELAHTIARLEWIVAQKRRAVALSILYVALGGIALAFLSMVEQAL